MVQRYAHTQTSRYAVAEADPSKQLPIEGDLRPNNRPTSSFLRIATAMVCTGSRTRYFTNQKFCPRMPSFACH
jgi:hypothetical protein